MHFEILISRKMSLLLNILRHSFVPLGRFSGKQVQRTVFRKSIRECSWSHPLLKGRGRKGRRTGQRDKLSFHGGNRQP